MRALLDQRAITSVFQPICRLGTDDVVGYEALARMSTSPRRGPDVWLRAAEAAGLRAELEVACLASALQRGLPPDGRRLFVNLSPSLVADPRVEALLSPITDRLVLELSEQEEVRDYPTLAAQLARWRARGAGVAIDDTGSGYASLRHVLRLEPDYIKLDRALVEGVDTDRSVRKLIASFVDFAQESGAQVIAEGIETHDQLHVLRESGVQLGQGYLLGRPGPSWIQPVADTRELSVEGAASPEDLGELVCAYLSEALGVMPSLYLEQDGLLRCVAQRGLWQVLDGLAPGAGITGRSFAENVVVVSRDVQQSDGYLEAIPGVVAEACVPLRVHGMPVGALNIDSTRTLADDDVRELSRVGELVNGRLEALGFRRKIDPMARLVASAVQLDAATDEDEVIEIVLDAAIAISGLDSSVWVQAGPDGTLAAPSLRGELRGTLDGRSLREMEPLVASDVPWRSCYTAGEDLAAGMIGTEGLRRSGVRTIIAIPVRPASAPRALLAVLSTCRLRLHTNQIELLELLAGQAASRLEVLAHIESLHQQARRDHLTGLGNRVAFSASAAEWQMIGRRGTLCLLDIDRFKHINDTFGHAEGDLALREFGKALRDATRPGDTVYRLGGDEFALLLPDAGLEDMPAIEARLEAAATRVLEPRGAWVSLGCAPFGGAVGLAQATRAADARLYRSKGSAPSDRRATWEELAVTSSPT